jgi:hypothetical protein
MRCGTADPGVGPGDQERLGIEIAHESEHTSRRSGEERNRADRRKSPANAVAADPARPGAARSAATDAHPWPVAAAAGSEPALDLIEAGRKPACGPSVN